MKKKVSCILLVLILLLAGCANTDHSPTQSAMTKQYKATYLDIFDTVTVILGYAEDEAAFKHSADQMADELREYHKLFDIYKEYEGIHNLKTVNDHAGVEAVKVENAIIDLLTDCKRWYEATDGAVNVAMGSVLSIWHEARSDGMRNPAAAYLPSSEALSKAVQHIDFDTVVIDEAAKTVYLTDPAQRLDVGAIAKGWAVDRVCENAPEGMILSVGGNIKATGAKPDGSAWVVGVQDPKQKDGAYLKKLGITDQSVVTSGDYQRFYTVDGENYHHIIDPKTAYPAKGYASVTVICDDSGTADALSTALFILPRAEGEKLLAQFDASAIWVDQDGRVSCSEGAKAFMQE